MKRLMPASLISFLQANQVGLVKADCFVITLPTGTVLYVTEGQFDITFLSGTPGWNGAQTTFKATQYGVWSRGAITSEASFTLNAGTMDLMCVPQQNTTYPGLPMGIAGAAHSHLFDAATVWVYTAYFLQTAYGNVSNGVETKFQGTITETVNIGRAGIQFKCADPLYLAAMKIPSRLLQVDCEWQFCDANCTLSKTDYTVNFTAASGSTQTALTPTSAFSQAAGYFTQGIVKCLTGNNAGLSQSVKAHAGGVLQMPVAWVLPIQAGDTFSVIKGCDKTVTMCKATVKASGASIDNSLNFSGTPLAPVPNAAF